MPRYAADTSVSCESSRGEIERTLARYGATSFAYMTSQAEAMIAFEASGRRVVFRLPLPDRQSDQFRMTPAGRRRRNDSDALQAWEQACRQRWRALNLCIKAKLEAVECGITTFYQEFLAHIVLPDGQTVGDYAIPQIAKAYETGEIPPLLPAPKGARK